MSSDMRMFLRWLLLALGLCGGAIAMYFALYYGWIAATPVEGREFYESRGNAYFYLSFLIAGAGVVAFLWLRQKQNSKPDKGERT